jgi:hypothetical protein
MNVDDAGVTADPPGMVSISVEIRLGGKLPAIIGYQSIAALEISECLPPWLLPVVRRDIIDENEVEGLQRKSSTIQGAQIGMIDQFNHEGLPGSGFLMVRLEVGTPRHPLRSSIFRTHIEPRGCRDVDAGTAVWLTLCSAALQLQPLACAGSSLAGIAMIRLPYRR